MKGETTTLSSYGSLVCNLDKRRPRRSESTTIGGRSTENFGGYPVTEGLNIKVRRREGI